MKCPDGVSTCPDGNTCCKTDAGYGCCPLPNAVCCSEHAHCCPHGYECETGGYFYFFTNLTYFTNCWSVVLIIFAPLALWQNTVFNKIKLTRIYWSIVIKSFNHQERLNFFWRYSFVELQFIQGI